MAETPARLGERLIAAGKLNTRDLDRALAAQAELGGLLGQVLVRLGVVAERDVAEVLAQQLGVPLVLAESFPALPLRPDSVRAEFLAAHQLLPLAISETHLRVAMVRPQDAFARKALALATGLQVEPCLGLESEIEAALRASDDPEASALEGSESGAEFVEHLRDLASEAPVIRIVNNLVGQVIELRASDIHLEPFEDGLQVRYRVDGVIQRAEHFSPSLTPAVISRVKLLANLDIAERRLPQDGRIRLRVKGRELDLRVSTVPTVYGESVVMRVLDRASVRFGLADMGFAADHLQRLQALLDRPHGIVLVTGPTGSGKTTTLYAALARMDAAALKILTVEDPVEYQLPGINQIQVHPQIGLSFAHALRSILRQDPDIIMIGEMRDTETAQIAVQSALTGHLVLSTLHTNTAASAVIRLQDMGIERYLITSSVNGIVAQRLVRRLCPHCKTPVHPPAELLERTGLGRWLPAGAPMYAPVGCAECRHTGYQGRTSIHELLVLDEPLHSAILRGADAGELQTLARTRGMRTLYEDGLRQVAEGHTSLDEVLRATQDQTYG